MGIPRFFQWMRGRYPRCIKLITDNRIPEFDNLYLDMNCIIHNCSHSNDGDSHSPISEDKIFQKIFDYIDHLFIKINPKKLFFMAIDGVAPRAKMNEQRARRFRNAKKRAECESFDRNCITPGTKFMANLSLQLRHFISKKVTEDADWKNTKIVLSGHEVPGEGEHKIMEYIRNAKAQADYDPNVEHCLYGSDADLIMLGLLSHEQYFALLREEDTSFLIRLSSLRECLDQEFSVLKKQLPFGYNLERIIDDFILLTLFIGNDFLPHLPNLHIAESALRLVLDVYKKILPLAGGYINDGGILDIVRLEKLFKELSIFERTDGEYADMKRLKEKRQKLDNTPKENTDEETVEMRDEQKDEKDFVEWKKNYYKEKMRIDYDDRKQMDGIVGSYIEGLKWVLHYYYKGIASWGWFYPYHYSPKISDLHELGRFDIQFELGKPFTPFEQLMGILPEFSKGLLPESYQDLMINPDSPIIDFYKESELDKIPFIDQERLVAALKDKRDKLTDEEKQRDTNDDSLLFIWCRKS